MCNSCLGFPFFLSTEKTVGFIGSVIMVSFVKEPAGKRRCIIIFNFIVTFLLKSFVLSKRIRVYLGC